jgi:hypothetical protein
MKQSILEEYVNAGLSIRQIAASQSVSYPTIRHWLKKYNLKTLTKQYSRTEEYRCKCGEIDPKKFYGHKKQICSNCHNIYNTKKARETKAFARDILGGKCNNCGYDKCYAALDIHHVDPKKKSSNFANHVYWNIDKLKLELEGCKLLCRNCHAEEHYPHLIK